MKYSQLCPYKCPFCFKKLSNQSRNDNEVEFFCKNKHSEKIFLQYDILFGNLTSSYLILRLNNQQYQILNKFNDSVINTIIDEKIDNFYWKTILHLPPTHFDFSSEELIKNKFKLILAFS